MNENIFMAQTESKEEYTFNYTMDELTTLYKLQRTATYKKPVRGLIVLLIINIMAFVISAPHFAIGFAMGGLVTSLIFVIKSIRNSNKMSAKNLPKLAQTTYEYKIYDEYFVINFYRNNELTRQSKYYFEDIEPIQKFDKWLLLPIRGQAFIIRESDLKENAVFLSYVQKNKK